MSKKLAKADNEAMNRLFASELSKAGIKTAAAEESDAGRSDDPQAFKDHEDYIKTVEDAFKSDKKVEGGKDPNDVLFD